MGCFQVNNFDANWKFNPPNLFGGKNSHSNRNQGAVRTSPDAGYGMDAAMSNCSRHSEDVETEGYDSPCFCGAGTMEAGEMPGMPGISYERGSPVPRGPGESRARRAVPVNGGARSPGSHRSPGSSGSHRPYGPQRGTGRPRAGRASGLSPEQHIRHVYGPGAAHAGERQPSAPDEDTGRHREHISL